MAEPFSHTFPGQISVVSYVHRIYGYRYNWHLNMYEVDIVLSGMLEFIRGGEKHILRPKDIIIVDPGVGHASYPLSPDTVSLVMRFSARALNDFISRGHMRSFTFSSENEDNDTQTCRLIRYFAAQMVLALADGCTKGSGRNIVRSSLGMIAFLISTQLPSEVVPKDKDGEADIDSFHLASLTKYVWENSGEKLVLQDIADEFHYNRTYISTLFRQTMGIGFHDYLTRIRLQKAIYELGSSSKNLSQIALDNGFPDLKTFNQEFADIFGTTPKQYRTRLLSELKSPGLIPDPGRPLIYLDPREPELYKLLQEFLTI